ncbi:MAG: RDD family protein [Synergistaceae bacterium]|jgi:uncharacterized RDD family membrane protein YckC|nr:RDD family protein [Synergistaceae bacterium]
MPDTPDRVGRLVDGISRKTWTVVSPEGVALEVPIASKGERLAAFMIDIALMTAALVMTVILLVILIFSNASMSVSLTLILFLSFAIRNMYFIHFELAWQGRTPGKKICSLRVINRAGGELSPSAVIARSLTREVEFFLPLSVFLTLEPGGGAWRQLTLLGWACALTALPCFNRGHLRAGDLIGGTIVISMPKRVLRADLTEKIQASGGIYSFSQRQLSIYGAFELQVLEELLRRPQTGENDRILGSACEKISRKIGMDQEIPPGEDRRFLEDFYAAEREALERGQLFGHYKADKTAD